MFDLTYISRKYKFLPIINFVDKVIKLDLIFLIYQLIVFTKSNRSTRDISIIYLVLSLIQFSIENISPCHVLSSS
jgi:hypothetical protein